MCDNINYRLVTVATQGDTSEDARRLKLLCRDLNTTSVPFSKTSKIHSSIQLFKSIRHTKPDLVVMEGTGLGGGIALILANVVSRVPYIVSSGDAVAPYIASKRPWLQPLFSFYERMLYSRSSGFVGWTPYLVGRALTFRAPRAITVQGWAPFTLADNKKAEFRGKVRLELGIAPNDIVIGIVGSLNWNSRVGFCYGYELVQAIKKVYRQDVKVLIVGDGDGKQKLEALAGLELGNRVIMTGRVSRDKVPQYLAAMDIASLPQSRDQVGSFRYTTKISEYLAAGLPVVTGQLPFAYDFRGDWMWRLAGQFPWESVYIDSLVKCINELEPDLLERKRQSIPMDQMMFDGEHQINRFTIFVQDIIKACGLAHYKARRSLLMHSGQPKKKSVV